MTRPEQQSGGHTKGPWRADDLSAHYTEDGHAAIYAGPVVIAFVRGYDLNQATNRANASLIAAAPDLLNALRTLADAAESRGIPCDAARAAITKAVSP